MQQHLSLNVDADVAVFDRALEGCELEQVLAACSFEVVQKGFRGRKSVVTKCLYDQKRNSLPAGLVPRVQAVLPQLVTTYRKRLVVDGSATFTEPRLRHYQVTAKDTLLAAGRGAVNVPTGCGKSLISAALAASHRGHKVLVTVPSTRLMHQTSADLASALGETVGTFGDGRMDLTTRVVVATIQSLGKALTKAKKVKGRKKVAPGPAGEFLRFLADVDVWVCDEAHGAAADTYVAVGEALTSCWHRYGLTATWQREDGMELVMEGVLGPQVYEYPYQVAFEEGFLTPPTIVWQQVPDNVVWLNDSFHTAQNEQYVFNLGRHLKVAADVTELVDAGLKNVLVLVDRLDQGEQLASILDAPFVSGASDQDSLEQALLDLDAGRLKVLVASGILNVGVNLPNLASIVNACGGKSKIEAAQKVGRGLRLAPGKTRLLYLEYVDEESKVLRKHAGTRRLWYSRLFGPSANVDIGSGRLRRFLEAS